MGPRGDVIKRSDPNSRVRWRNVALIAILAAVALAGLVACGEKGEEVASTTRTTPTDTEPFSITLNFSPNADHAGIFMAEKLGFFEDAGLKIDIHTPVVPNKPVYYVATKTVDVAISHAPQVLLAHDTGHKLVAIDAIVDRPLTSLIWLPDSNIKGIADLRGKTIAIAGVPYQTAYLQAILAHAGLTLDDVRVKDVGYGMLSALIAGRADAMLGGFSNVEGLELRLRGEDPIVTPAEKLGVPPYDELVVIARRGRLEKNPGAIRRFLVALQRGTIAAKEDPEAATEALLEANPELNPKLTRAGVSTTLPLLSTSGQMDPAKWAALIGWMNQKRLINGKPQPSSVMSNKFLPGELPG